jgi:hypothetical protein
VRDRVSEAIDVHVAGAEERLVSALPGDSSTRISPSATLASASRSANVCTMRAASASDFGSTCSPSSAISSVEFGPRRTRTGGLCGFSSLALELS